MRTILFLLLVASTASAQIPRNPYITEDEWDLALAVARVAANEASLSTIRPADVGLIWQVTQGHGDTAETRLRWLRQHSPCVLGEAPLTAEQRQTNCAWSRFLRADDGAPEGWPSSLVWASFLPTWRRVRDLALAFVLGTTNRSLPCEQTPYTWGGFWDHEGSVARGLVPVVCHGSVNVGYVSARRLRGRLGVHATRARARTLRSAWP